ncbi:MAG: pantoate--beta-alanine ligase [Polyangiales bacterium]
MFGVLVKRLPAVACTERLAIDLNFPVNVVGCPIIRQSDGLCIVVAQRFNGRRTGARAVLGERFKTATEASASGERDAVTLRTIVFNSVKNATDRIDYVEIVNPASLEPLSGSVDDAVVLIAAHVGNTRLIDNAP